MSQILVLLKFGQKKHMLDLIRNGTLYMNSIQYFRNLEDKKGRGDSYEGVIEVKNSLPGEFEIPSIGYKGNHLGVHIRQTHEEVLGNIYSLYAISSNGWGSPADFFIDERNKEFGSRCVMIKDIGVFFDLVGAELDRLGVKYHHGFVKYYDKNEVNRKISLFEKPLEFEHQKEFRFYVERDASDAFKIQIGNIEHIAELFTSKDIVDGLTLEPKSTTDEMVREE